MENAEEVFHFLEDFSKRKPKIIPQELNEYLAYVARTGDPVYQWSLVKSLFKEKLLNVITDFYETSPGIDIPPYPNVDPFNYDVMKNSLLERLDSFTSAPFTVQRICELLTFPRKQYNRIDKFMRAIEKNILVVSTREPGIQRHAEPENGEPMEPIVNGSDNNSDYNVDVEMEDMSWKENAVQQRNSEPQPSSSDTPISVNAIEAHLQTKEDTPMDTQEKTLNQYESVTPPEMNIASDEQTTDTKGSKEMSNEETTVSIETPKTEGPSPSEDSSDQARNDVEMKNEPIPTPTLVVPEIKIDTVEMTEEKCNDLSNVEQPSMNLEDKLDETAVTEKENIEPEVKCTLDSQQAAIDESSSDSNSKDDSEPKAISEVSTSSEESSSSSDNTDGNSNSPRTDSGYQIDTPEESNQSNASLDTVAKPPEELKEEKSSDNTPPITSDNYSISDVNSELPQVPSEEDKQETSTVEESKESIPDKIEPTAPEGKSESCEAPKTVTETTDL